MASWAVVCNITLEEQNYEMELMDIALLGEKPLYHTVAAAGTVDRS